MLFGCTTKSTQLPTTDTDVATTFIRNILDNKFSLAEPFLLKDDANMQYFERFKQEYEKKDKAELAKFKEANINMNEIVALNDSVHIFNYSNSYKKEIKQKIKLVWQNNKWQVDLKYTFNENQ